MYDKVSVQDTITAPEVEAQMLDPNYWVAQNKENTKEIMNKAEIEEFNLSTFATMREIGKEEYLYNLWDNNVLEKYPDTIKTGDFLRRMPEHSKDDFLLKRDFYNIMGKKISINEKKDLLKGVDIDEPGKSLEVGFGLLLRKGNLRAFPTIQRYAPSPEEIDMDLLQLTTLPANSPLLILNKSRDGKWAYVQSVIYSGWLQSKDIVLVRSRSELTNFLNTDRYMVVAASRVETEPNPFSSEISNIKYQMGDRLPLVSSEEIPTSIPADNPQAQSAHGNYVIKVPLHNEHGYLCPGMAFIKRNCDLSNGYMSYTRENIIRQAFKMLGERYGWGGLYDRRDCSRFVMDIYRTVGITLPRDTSTQEKGTAGQYLSFSGTISEREKTLDLLEAGDLLYMKGHVMLYLGKVGDKKYYVIHAGGGYAIEEQIRLNKTRICPVTVHSVFVMELHQLLKDGSKRFIEALSGAKKINLER